MGLLPGRSEYGCGRSHPIGEVIYATANEATVALQKGTPYSALKYKTNGTANSINEAKFSIIDLGSMPIIGCRLLIR
jgi:hypothetical protein